MSPSESFVERLPHEASARLSMAIRARRRIRREHIRANPPLRRYLYVYADILPGRAGRLFRTTRGRESDRRDAGGRVPGTRTQLALSHHRGPTRETEGRDDGSARARIARAEPDDPA